AREEGAVGPGPRLPLSVPRLRGHRRPAGRARRFPLKRALLVAFTLLLVAASVATAARIRGTAGPNRLQSVNGIRDNVTCGGGYDVATVDAFDHVGRDCEVVSRETSRDPYANTQSQHQTQADPDS